MDKKQSVITNFIWRLLERGGTYRKLYETQFSKALLPPEEGVSELEQYIWGQQAADEPVEEDESGK